MYLPSIVGCASLPVSLFALCSSEPLLFGHEGGSEGQQELRVREVKVVCKLLNHLVDSLFAKQFELPNESCDCSIVGWRYLV